MLDILRPSFLYIRTFQYKISQNEVLFIKIRTSNFICWPFSSKRLSFLSVNFLFHSTILHYFISLQSPNERDSVIRFYTWQQKLITRLTNRSVALQGLSSASETSSLDTFAHGFNTAHAFHVHAARVMHVRPCTCFVLRGIAMVHTLLVNLVNQTARRIPVAAVHVM